jgi:hypothetical protein
MNKQTFIQLCSQLKDNDWVTMELIDLFTFNHYSNDPNEPDAPPTKINHLALQANSKSKEELWTKYITAIEQVLRDHWQLSDDEIYMTIEDQLATLIKENT